MPKFDVAHIRQQGQDIIVIPLESSFGNRISSDQRATILELQMRSRAAGLAGTVVPVWDAGSGRMGFIAPQQWHPYFQSISLQFVAANINRSLSW
jgi:hypothetical protein